MGTAALIVAALVCGWAFQAGKRQGSRKGYYVGRKTANRKNSGKRSGRLVCRVNTNSEGNHGSRRYFVSRCTGHRLDVAGVPDRLSGHALKLTLLCGIPQAVLAIKLFLECKCGEKKDA